MVFDVFCVEGKNRDLKMTIHLYYFDLGLWSSHWYVQSKLHLCCFVSFINLRVNGT